MIHAILGVRAQP